MQFTQKETPYTQYTNALISELKVLPEEIRKLQKELLKLKVEESELKLILEPLTDQYTKIANEDKANKNETLRAIAVRELLQDDSVYIQYAEVLKKVQNKKDELTIEYTYLINLLSITKVEANLIGNLCSI